MKKSTAIIYSFNTQKSKKVSEKIVKEWKTEDIEPVNVEEIDKNIFNKYDNFILSTPTWFDGELPNYWDEFLPELEEINFFNKKFAIFGLGDQRGYPENFCDAIGIMANVITKQGGRVIGHFPTDGYNFESSKARKGDFFVGLPIDQENQPGLTDERITKWIKSLKKEFK